MDVKLAGSAISYVPDDDQLQVMSVEFAAFDGEVGIGALPIQDTAAAIDVYNGRACQVNEIATRLSDGFIIDQDNDRGPEPASVARQKTFSIMDANALLDGFRYIGTRPSETDVQRVLSAATRFSGATPSVDTTWVLNTHTVTMPKKKYSADKGWTSELIPDVVQFTGKTLFMHDKADGSGRCLHYHRLVDGHTCGLTISDVPSAVNGTTVFAPGQPRRARTSRDLTNDVRGLDQKGRTSFQRDTTSITNHDADGLEHEAFVQFDADSQADLDTLTAAHLAEFKDDYDTYTCTIGPLDATALSKIRVGDIITVTSSVMQLTASPQRISHMRLTVFTGKTGAPAPGLWDAELELGQPLRKGGRGAAAGSPPTSVPPPTPTPQPPGGGPLPFPSSCQRDDFNRTVVNGLGNADYGGVPWSLALDVTNPNTPNEWQVGAGVAVVDISDGNSVSNATLAFGGPTISGDYYCDFSCDVDGSFISDGDITFLLSESILPMRFIVDVTGKNEFSVTCTSGKWQSLGVPQRSDQFIFVYPTDGSYGTVETPIAPNAGAFLFDADEPYQMRLHIEPGNAYVDINGTRLYAGDDLDISSSDTITAAGFQIQLEQTGNPGGGYPGGSPNLTPAFTTVYMVQYCTGTLEFPSGGQPVGPEIVGIGDGVETSFFTRFPYAPGSLKVYDNGARVFNIFETFPEERQFDFAVAPAAGDTIRAEYQGATPDVPPIGPPGPDQGPTALQDLIDAASSGDTIDVPFGTYHETITVDKPLTLMGNGSTITGDTTRAGWVTIAADDVSMYDFIMKDADPDPASAMASPQEGSFECDGFDRLYLNNVHGQTGRDCGLRLQNSDGSKLVGCSFTFNPRAGATMGGSGAGLTNLEMTDCQFNDNLTDLTYDPQWEGGGYKIGGSNSDGILITRCEASRNNGVGHWIDVAVSNVTYNDCWGHHNAYSTFMYEISTNGQYNRCRSWESGWGDPRGNGWGWGAGFLISSSGTVDLTDCISAWDSAGITRINQGDRVDRVNTTALTGFNNTIVAANGRRVSSWHQDGATNQVLFTDPTNTEIGLNYWPTGSARFAWNGDISASAFAATRGGADLTLLTIPERDAILDAAGIPKTRT